MTQLQIWILVLCGFMAALALFMIWWDAPAKNIFSGCPRCHGKGYRTERGDRIPKSDLSPTEHAEWMVEGTAFYKAVKRTCHRCGGSGKRNSE